MAKKTTNSEALLLFPGGHPDVRKTGPQRKKCNELDGATWLKYSISVWDDIAKSKEEARIGHPAMFPVALVTRLIEMCLTSHQTVVMDPFVGSGSTMVGALQTGRQGIGFDISPDYLRLAERRCKNTNELLDGATDAVEPALILSDARQIIQHLAPNSVDMCITSPPYWDILTQKRSADGKDIRNYGNRLEDLGTIADYKKFLSELKKVFEQAFVVLRPASFCVVVVMDLRKKDTFYPFHSDIADCMTGIGFIHDDIIIWNRKAEYNNLRPLGYPSVFRVNKVHEYVLLFKTPAAKTKASLDTTLKRRIRKYVAFD